MFGLGQNLTLEKLPTLLFDSFLIELSFLSQISLFFLKLQLSLEVKEKSQRKRKRRKVKEKFSGNPGENIFKLYNV